MMRKSIPSKRDGGGPNAHRQGGANSSQILESNHLESRNQAGTKGPSLSGTVGWRGFGVSLQPCCWAVATDRWPAHQGRGGNHSCIPGVIQSAGTFLLL